jgi:ribonuclease Z
VITKIIPLGTSSGKPTLARNVSATAIVGEGEWWLFDCGEGTQMQIARAGLSSHRLAGIFITHLHGDHFNGLAGLLSTLGLNQREHELTLVGPPGLGEYLDLVRRLRILYLNFSLRLREVSWSDFDTGSSDEGLPSRPLLVYESEKYTVVTRPLDHRLFALGYRVQERTRPGRFNVERARELGIPEGPLYGQLQRGFEVRLPDGRVIYPSDVLGPPRPGKAVAYCLDTRPCANAVELARGANYLIHEATYTEDLIDEAYLYGHSTAAQAARTARLAGAERLLITHFSSRFPDARPLLAEARAIFPATIMAEDLVEIEVR